MFWCTIAEMVDLKHVKRRFRSLKVSFRRACVRAIPPGNRSPQNAADRGATDLNAGDLSLAHARMFGEPGGPQLLGISQILRLLAGQTDDPRLILIRHGNWPASTGQVLQCGSYPPKITLQNVYPLHACQRLRPRLGQAVQQLPVLIDEIQLGTSAGKRHGP